MRKYSADFILSPEGHLVPNHVVVVDAQGKVINFMQGATDDVIHYEGILCPGFINTHCHLELSHLKGKIDQGTRLTGFIKDFVQARQSIKSGIALHIAEADAAMWKSGIEGVGDICNTDLTFDIKKSSAIRYHSFIEVFNLDATGAHVSFEEGIHKYMGALAIHKYASVIPHAPYSVPPELFVMIKQHQEQLKTPWCIHNQESEAENTMFLSRSGELWDFLNGVVTMDWFKSKWSTSLRHISKFFPEKTNLLLVHNTYTSQSDIEFLKKNDKFNQTWFCLCPKANRYIEKRLPDIKMFFESGCKLTIGTDSLASNDTLSVLEELKSIHHACPDIPVEDLLTWATRNGAEYLGWNDLGSFKKNSQPGIILITNANANQIKSDSKVQRIL